MHGRPSKLEVGMNTGSHDELVFNVVKQGVVNMDQCPP